MEWSAVRTPLNGFIDVLANTQDIVNEFGEEEDGDGGVEGEGGGGEELGEEVREGESGGGDEAPTSPRRDPLRWTR